MRIRQLLAAAIGAVLAVQASAGPLAVTTARAAKRPYSVRVDALAQGRSSDRLVIDAPFSGVMAPLPLLPGSAVARNTVVAHVLPLALAAEVEAATAEEQSARRAYIQSQILARHGLLTAAQLLHAKAGTQHARAVLYGLRARLDRGVVRAPFPGTITYLVPAGAWVGPGTAIAKLSGTGGFYLTAEISPRAARLVKSGAPARITADGRSWAGTVYAVAERAGRGGLVTIYLKCACHLFAGEFARVHLKTAATPGIAVPNGAVVMTDGKTFVYRITSGHAQTVRVHVAHVGHHWTWLEGLTPGTQIVVGGAGRIRSGTRVSTVSAR